MPGGPYTDDAEMRPLLKATLQRLNLPTTSTYDTLLPKGIVWAYRDIADILLGRGYTIAQIDAWDSAKTYNQQLALYWTIILGGVTHDYDEDYLNQLDRREDLKTVVIAAGNVVPDDETTGTTVGKIEGEGDVFSMDSEI